MNHLLYFFLHITNILVNFEKPMCGILIRKFSLFIAFAKLKLDENPQISENLLPRPNKIHDDCSNIQ